MRFEFEGTMDELRSIFAVPQPVETTVPRPVGGTTAQMVQVRDKYPDVWTKFKQFCLLWIQGFGQLDVEQPDRVQLMVEIGTGRWPYPILLMTAEVGSLQRLVEQALIEAGQTPAKDFVEQVAANMVQVSHVGFPDLMETFDHLGRWRA